MWDMLYTHTHGLENVSGDNLSEFYPPLKSPLLMMSNTAESGKISAHILRWRFSLQISSSLADQSVLHMNRQLLQLWQNIIEQIDLFSKFGKKFEERLEQKFKQIF